MSLCSMPRKQTSQCVASKRGCYTHRTEAKLAHQATVATSCLAICDPRSAMSRCTRMQFPPRVHLAGSIWQGAWPHWPPKVGQNQKFTSGVTVCKFRWSLASMALRGNAIVVSQLRGMRLQRVLVTPMPPWCSVLVTCFLISMQRAAIAKHHMKNRRIAYWV